ncbi:MAG: response regulator transcription factor [Bacteroidetes bacterium]|nr:response regulator transcription factor [Bacteroidota bacterium]
MKSPIPIKLVIADDHEIYRDGLKIMLRRQADMEVIGEAANGRELVELAEKLRPDIILTDIVMPLMDGIEATRLLKQQLPSIHIIALSMFDQDNLIIEMLESGAKGYLLKNADKREIIEAIQSVSKEVPYYCRSTSVKLARMIAHSKFNRYKAAEKPAFSDKEIEIIRLICREYTNKEIGKELFLSARTVEGYRVKILEKMQVKSTAGIVIYAIKNGMFRLDK